MRARTQIIDRRRPRRRRTGVSALYSIILLTALIGMSSLGVDYARVQLAKTELQRGADAAARYAASTLSSGTATARSNAVACAAQNTVDGQSLVLDPKNKTLTEKIESTKTTIGKGSPAKTNPTR